MSIHLALSLTGIAAGSSQVFVLVLVIFTSSATVSMFCSSSLTASSLHVVSRSSIVACRMVSSFEIELVGDCGCTVGFSLGGVCCSAYVSVVHESSSSC